jgi:hypothetical protein
MKDFKMICKHFVIYKFPSYRKTFRPALYNMFYGREMVDLDYVMNVGKGKCNCLDSVSKYGGIRPHLWNGVG